MAAKAHETSERDADVFDLLLSGDDLVVISLPSDAGSGLQALTRAERDVVCDVLAGHSTAAIAHTRGRSPRTVANQLASVYRKLGVGSRAELAARLAGESGDEGDR